MNFAVLLNIAIDVIQAKTHKKFDIRMNKLLCNEKTCQTFGCFN